MFALCVQEVLMWIEGRGGSDSLSPIGWNWPIYNSHSSYIMVLLSAFNVHMHKL